MPRIPLHTIESAPAASRSFLEPLLQNLIRPGHLLNLHAAMAHAPVLIATYAQFRDAIDQYATLDPKTRTAIMVTTSAVEASAYALSLNSLLASRAGWGDSEISAMHNGADIDAPRISSLLAVVREVAGNSRFLTGPTWRAALDDGWTTEQMTEAFAIVTLVRYVCQFATFAEVDSDTGSAETRETRPDALRSA